MPIYFFNLRTGTGTVRDLYGTELADDSAAGQHARQVAHELMSHNRPRTRHWRLVVCDHERRPCLDLLFATVDDTVRNLSPELRASVEMLCAKTASLCEAVDTVRSTVQQIKATIARSKGSLYIAANDGEIFT